MQALQQRIAGAFGRQQGILEEHGEDAGAQADQHGTGKLQLPMLTQDHAPTARLLSRYDVLIAVVFYVLYLVWHLLIIGGRSVRRFVFR